MTAVFAFHIKENFSSNSDVRSSYNWRWYCFVIPTVEAMAGPVSLELDPIFLKGLSYLHSKSKDSAEKLKALLDESLARGSDSSYRSLQKVWRSKQIYVYSCHALLYFNRNFLKINA